MPKDTGKENSRTRYQVQAQAEVQKLATHLMVDNRGEEAREIEITFSTADQKDVSKRAEMIDKVLKQTPNLTKLTLDFSGWLYKPSDCIGEALLETMCKLTKLEHFENHQTAGTRIDFGLYELRKLVSSWPNLRTLYLAGDTQGSQKAEDIPSATCALESVTLERFFSRYESLAPIFAGSANSMKSLEIWAMGAGELDTILRPVIPSIEDITFGGGHYPTSSFLKDELSKAPNLHTLRFCGAFTDNRVRLTFSEVLKNDDAYPALRYLEYPAQEGTYKTGRGRNVRVHEYENPGQEELLEVCRKRDIRANVGRELKYSVEGAGRRAGFAALARRGW